MCWWVSQNTLGLLLTSCVVAVLSDGCVEPSSIGCFTNPYKSPLGSTQVLSKLVSKASSSMTPQACISLCCTAGYGVGSLAGVQAGTDCYCDHGLGPYTIPTSSMCNVSCTGNAHQTCGGISSIQVLGIASCPHTPGFSRSTPLKQCGRQGCTRCPVTDTCCIGRQPDPYRVVGGYGCAPPDSINTTGCAGGGTFPGGCCCAPGPTVVSSVQPNVLIVGDSVSAGYISAVKSLLEHEANVQHGPDNSGGGNADGVGYGRLCIDYFVRTPTHELPTWDVITFNFGLHDGADTNHTYTQGLSTIADSLLAATFHNASKLIYFLTTIPGGSGSVPGEPVSPDDKRVMELNYIATEVMQERNITVVDLYAAMTKCGISCKDCKPHCGPEGYAYLAKNAIVPAIKAALQT